MSSTRLGDHLVQRGLITELQLAVALQQQERTGCQRVAGLVDPLLAAEDLPGKDQRPPPLARRHQATFHEELIGARATRAAHRSRSTT